MDKPSWAEVVLKKHIKTKSKRPIQRDLEAILAQAPFFGLRAKLRRNRMSKKWPGKMCLLFIMEESAEEQKKTESAKPRKEKQQKRR